MTLKRGSAPEFNNALHALRAFAATMVFAVHLFDSFNTHFFPAYEPLNAAMPYIKRFGTFGVELFFIISGFVIMNSLSKYTLREFYLRRLIRIYPVFAFFTLAFFFLNWIEHVYPEKYAVGPLLLNLAFLNLYSGTAALSPNAWSLTFEANFYVLAGLACFLFRERRAIALALLSIAVIAILIAFPIASYFLAGCVLYAARGLQPSSVPRILQLAVFATWCALAATIDHESTSMLNVVLLAASTIFVFVVTVPNSLFARMAAVKWVFFLGVISYSFYLAHPYAYYVSAVLFRKIGLDSWSIGAAAAAYFPAMTAAAIGFSFLVYRLLEDAPYRAAFGESVFKKMATPWPHWQLRPPRYRPSRS